MISYKFIIVAVLSGCLLNVAVPGQAHAYIDMGTGSMVFQMIVAGLVGASFTIKMYWRSIVKKVRAFLGKSEPDTTTNNSDTHVRQHTED